MIQSQGVDIQIGVANVAVPDPMEAEYAALFAPLQWDVVPERNVHKPHPGRTPHPQQAYVKAWLIKQREKCSSMAMLRRLLVRHPRLVLALGFRAVPAPESPYRFDVEKTVPTARWLNQKLRRIDPDLLQAVLGDSVRVLSEAIGADFAQTVAVDTKHIYACVAENNPKVVVKDRYAPQRQPQADRDCKLGVKRRSNQKEPDQPGEKEFLWGYGSGIVTATHPQYGDVVLADYTQPFNEADVTYFTPLWARTRRHLGHTPRFLAADAAFDAWHVYEPFAQQQGIAAIPLNLRGYPPPRLGPHGYHLCPQAREMTPSYIYFDASRQHRVQILRCPLLHPTPTGQGCDHAQFAKGVGCEKRINAEAGGRLRVALDRRSETFRAIYRQRTSTERINAQAKAFGIERPKLRNLASIRNQNTLIYIVINVQAIQRVRRIQAKEVAQDAPLSSRLC
jgi:hypothetical protein